MGQCNVPLCNDDNMCRRMVKLFFVPSLLPGGSTCQQPLYTKFYIHYAKNQVHYRGVLSHAINRTTNNIFPQYFGYIYISMSKYQRKRSFVPFHHLCYYMIYCGQRPWIKTFYLLHHMRPYIHINHCEANIFVYKTFMAKDTQPFIS